MPDEPEKPKKVFALVNIDTASLGDAAKLFIEKICGAVGWLAKPAEIRRIAEAEADAKLTDEMMNIRVASLHRRAAQRRLNEDAQEQANLEAIAAAAVPQIEEAAQPDKIEPDWLTNFLDKARLTSDEEMQQLWAKILAGEANLPGKFSKRTVNFLASMDQGDAEKFKSLCRFNWRGFAGQPQPVIFDTQAPIYKDNGITWENVVHLEEIGLLTFESFAEVLISRQAPSPDLGEMAWFVELLMCDYGGKVYAVYPGPRPASLKVGRVKLSRVGADIASICDAEPVPGFVEFAISRWQAMGAKVREMAVNEVLKREMFGL